MQCLEKNSCGHQGYESSANRPILSLELDPKYKIATVDEALQKHFSIKEKSGSCIKCQNKRSDRRCITKPSEILMVQLNRTDDYRRHEHNEDPINFEGNIQLRKEYFDPQAEGIKNITYELTSVILRSGPNTYSGHYTIIVKGRTGKWTLIDDTETKPINFSNFCREPENKKNAYLFVYTRLSRNPSEDRMFRYNKIFTQDRVSKRLGITRKDGPELLNWSSGTRGPPGLLKMMDMVDSGTQTSPGNASALFANTTASSARQEPRTRIVTKSFISDSSSSDSSVASRKQMPRPALFTDSEISDSESNKSALSLSRSELSPMSVTDDGIEPIPRGSERQPSNKEIMDSNIELMRLLIAFKNQKKFSPPESYQKKAEESSQPSNADLLSSNIEIMRQVIALKNEKKFCPPESSQKQGEDISQISTAEILNSNAEIQRSNAEIIRLLKEQKKSSPPQSSRRQGEGQSQPLTEKILSSNAEILRVLKTLKAQKNPPVSETSQKRIGEPSQQQPITAELLSSNAEILKLLKTLKAQKSSSFASRSSKRKDSYLQPVDGTSDPAGPLMTDDQFEMKAYTEGRPYHNKNSWLRIQYIEYQSSDRENPDKSCRVPLDFAVRGYPVNLLKNPCDSGINADLISILGNLKEDDDIMVD